MTSQTGRTSFATASARASGIAFSNDNPSAKEAVALFVYRIGRELGSMVAALGGIDALVFTAGIGEHAAGIRRPSCCRGGRIECP
jgi:acetate kinase